MALVLVLGLLASPARGQALTVSASPVCFVVHNPGDPALPVSGPPAAVRGTRFQAAGSNPSRVIVLVHGINTWSRFWDLRPSFSIARRLAEAGFLVFAYDELGTGRSVYDYPLRATLTAGGQQVMLHEIVEQVRGRSVLRPGERNPCTGSSPFRVGPEPKVALIGHSAGTGLVQGYPGLYHGADPGRVDAIVLASIPICPGTSSPCVQTYIQKTIANQGREVSFFLDDGSYQPYSGAKSILQAPCHPIFLLCVGGSISGTVSPPSGQCKINVNFLLWPQATPADADLGDVCNPAGSETWPSLEWDNAGLASVIPALPGGLFGSADTSHTPRGFPVLLTWTDHDGFDAGNYRFDPAEEQANQSATVKAIRKASSAAVSSWTERDAGHAIDLDATMPTWVAKVASWLHASGF